MGPPIPLQDPDNPLHPAQVRRSCAGGQDDGECRHPGGRGWGGAEPPRCPRATGAAGLAAALALSPLPRLSQLDSLCAAAQALHALRSPDADLLPVLAAAVQVMGPVGRGGAWQAEPGAGSAEPGWQGKTG